MEFKFTESWPNVNSSLVKAVFHDDETDRMLVRLTGDKQYIYNNVERDTAEDIATADSAGAEYNHFRTKRGSLQTGNYAHNLRPVARPAKVGVAGNAASFEEARKDAGLPSKSGFTTTNVYNQYVAVSPTPYGGIVTRTYTVSFDWDKDEKTTSVLANSLTDAINKVENSFRVLNLNVTVTGVALKR